MLQGILNMPFMSVGGAALASAVIYVRRESPYCRTNSDSDVISLSPSPNQPPPPTTTTTGSFVRAMSFIIVGFFALTAGRRVLSEVPLSNGDTATVFHTLYSTAIVCSQQPARFSAEIHRYSPVDEAPLPENTTVFVVAKAYIPPEGVAGIVQLDALHFCPMSGNPSDENYSANHPDFTNPLILALGTVSADHEESLRGSLTFPVSLSEYLHGMVRQTILELRNFFFGCNSSHFCY